LCAFQRVTQRSKTGTSSSRLGNWVGWKDLPLMRKMEYQHGDKCWNGPERSTIVEVACGPESKILSVSEPAKCEYLMTFTTPGACDDPGTATVPARHPRDEL